MNSPSAKKTGITVQERIWKIMRGLSDFTVADIIILTELPSDSIRAYMALLAGAGYIRHIGSRKEGVGGPKKVWKLIKNTGPKPPAQRRCLYDANTNGLTEVLNRFEQRGLDRVKVRVREHTPLLPEKCKKKGVSSVA